METLRRRYYLLLLPSLVPSVNVLVVSLKELNKGVQIKGLCVKLK